MARLKITIEGEMSPEEMKRYIAAAWGNLPRDIAVSEIEPDEPSGTVKVPVIEQPAVAVVPVEVTVPDQPAASDLVAKLNECKKLSQLLQVLVEEKGAKTVHELIEFCKHYRAQVPNLERLGAGLEDRVTRTFEGMR